MYTYNPFGQPIEDFDKKTAGERVGRRIRTIRKENGLSQSELGERVGLNSNRVQQYENGARKPKFDLCKEFATALGVETNALLDPQVASYIGAMYAFFEMENLFDLRLKEVDGQICICFGSGQYDPNVGTMNNNLRGWFERRKEFEESIANAESDEERKDLLHEYHMWEWNFPFFTDENAAIKKSERVEMERKAKMITELQEEYNRLDEE